LVIGIHDQMLCCGVTAIGADPRPTARLCTALDNLS
jgi:hypothetical protein